MYLENLIDWAKESSSERGCTGDSTKNKREKKKGTSTNPFYQMQWGNSVRGNL